MGLEVKFKDVSKMVIKEGKKLPKPIWIAALVLPFGFQVVGVYLIVKTVMEKKKSA